MGGQLERTTGQRREEAREGKGGSGALERTTRGEYDGARGLWPVSRSLKMAPGVSGGRMGASAYLGRSHAIFAIPINHGCRAARQPVPSTAPRHRLRSFLLVWACPTLRVAIHTASAHRHALSVSPLCCAAAAAAAGPCVASRARVAPSSGGSLIASTRAHPGRVTLHGNR